MKNYRSILNTVVLIFACLLILSSQVWAEEEASKWDAAGKEITEAAKAVGDASGKIWQKTKETTVETMHDAKEKGAEAWDKTKEKSSELVGKTVEVSDDVAEGTVEESKGFWQKIKDKSQEWWGKAKAKVHEMTASDSQK